MVRWPDVGVALWGELERSAGRIALLVGKDAPAVAASLADLRGGVPTRVGRLLTEMVRRPTEPAVRAKLRGHSVLVDLEILFDPVLALDPVRLLGALAEGRSPVIAAWPTMTGTDPLHYPPGVGARYDTVHDMRGCLLLTTCPTAFADDPPFTIERFS